MSGTLRPSGGSIIVTLPPHALEHAGLSLGDSVDLVEAEAGFAIQPTGADEPLASMKLRREGSSTVCTVTKAIDETRLEPGDGVNIAVPFDSQRVNIRAEE